MDRKEEKVALKALEVLGKMVDLAIINAKVDLEGGYLESVLEEIRAEEGE